MSKQAAQKRFVPKDPGEPPLDPSQGFGRFTERARRALMVAHDEARSASSAEVTPEHLVLGLLSEPEGLAVRALTAQSVDLDALMSAAVAALPAAADEPPELVPYDARSRKALELTFREALRLGHSHVGTEHVLLALLEAENGSGVLTGLGVDKATAETDVRAALAGGSG